MAKQKILHAFSLFSVLVLFIGTLQKSIDEGLSGLKGSNPMPTAVVFGRVPLKGSLLFFPLVLTGVSTSHSLKILWKDKKN